MGCPGSRRRLKGTVAASADLGCVGRHPTQGGRRQAAGAGVTQAPPHLSSPESGQPSALDAPQSVQGPRFFSAVLALHAATPRSSMALGWDDERTMCCAICGGPIRADVSLSPTPRVNPRAEHPAGHRDSAERPGQRAGARRGALCNEMGTLQVHHRSGHRRLHRHQCRWSFLRHPRRRPQSHRVRSQRPLLHPCSWLLLASGGPRAPFASWPHGFDAPAVEGLEDAVPGVSCRWPARATRQSWCPRQLLPAAWSRGPGVGGRR